MESASEKGRICCNVCLATCSGIAYRTLCRHFYCPACATKAFQNGDCCDVCSSRLSVGDVAETVVGMNSSTPLMDTMYQIILGSGQSWAASMEALSKVQVGVAEIQMLLSTQISLSAFREDQQQKDDVQTIEHQRNEIEKMAEQQRETQASAEAHQREFERGIELKERELAELKDAYKEKSRKCQAWEKVN